MITNLLREGGFGAEGEENFICVKSGHNLSVSHGSHGGMGNEGRRRVRNLGYSTVYISTVIQLHHNYTIRRKWNMERGLQIDLNL